jgi:hypothetical protein
MPASRRSPVRLVLTFAAALLLAGCQSGTPTPIYIVVTPSPAPSVEVTPTPTPTPTPSPTAELTASASPSESPSPTATATSAASACWGTADNKDFYVTAAKAMKATVYCPTALGSGWNVVSGNWKGTKDGGWLTITYKYKSTTQTIEVKEGAFCLTSFAVCTGGSAFVVEMAGKFGPTSSPVVMYGAGTHAILVSAATPNAYFLIGHNMTPAAVAAIGANMKAVPKS